MTNTKCRKNVRRWTRYSTPWTVCHLDEMTGDWASDHWLFHCEVLRNYSRKLRKPFKWRTIWCCGLSYFLPNMHVSDGGWLAWWVTENAVSSNCCRHVYRAGQSKRKSKLHSDEILVHIQSTVTDSFDRAVCIIIDSQILFPVDFDNKISKACINSVKAQSFPSFPITLNCFVRLFEYWRKFEIYHYLFNYVQCSLCTLHTCDGPIVPPLPRFGRKSLP